MYENEGIDERTDDDDVDDDNVALDIFLRISRMPATVALRDNDDDDTGADADDADCNVDGEAAAPS